uniref:Post-GPI attachment to proteins factor 3 n=1 Tax=Caenorhabditis tropicalis TaxID=1561998 RepID=A0A1I7U2J1_9PELO
MFALPVIIDKDKLVYFLKDIWIFFIDPIYFILKHACNYTSVFPFLSNIVYWHVFPFLWTRTPFIMYEDSNTIKTALFLIYWLVFIFFLPIRVSCPKEQNIYTLKAGAIGLLVSSYLTLSLIILQEKGVDIEIYIQGAFVLASFSMSGFSSFWCDYYIQVPYDQMPYKRVNGYVVVIGIIHVLLTVIVLQFTTRYLECGSLLVASFFFSVDLYCIFTVDSYMIREHVYHKWDNNPEEGIIEHVVLKEKPDTVEH